MARWLSCALLGALWKWRASIIWAAATSRWRRSRGSKKTKEVVVDKEEDEEEVGVGEEVVIDEDEDEEEVLVGEEVAVVNEDVEEEEVVVQPINLVDRLQQQQQNYANVLLEHEREQLIHDFINLPVLQSAAIGNQIKRNGG